jgi:broad specificity phosphatase PhoE
VLETLILARHGESSFSVAGLVNGDPTVRGPLTDAGRAQARALGEALRGRDLDLCVTTQFDRTRETADVALAGRDVPRLVVPELDDIRMGEYEGKSLEDYRSWAHTCPPTESSPGGGESRVAAMLRFLRGFHVILARPEQTILHIGHSLPLRYLLDAAQEEDPRASMGQAGYAEPHELDRPAFQRAVERLERWALSPHW